MVHLRASSLAFSYLLSSPPPNTCLSPGPVLATSRHASVTSVVPPPSGQWASQLFVGHHLWLRVYLTTCCCFCGCSPACRYGLCRYARALLTSETRLQPQTCPWLGPSVLSEEAGIARAAQSNKSSSQLSSPAPI
ncbi:hypothetical protein LZ31DRAFT_549692 [Colletotrichum somersetense]|nr:hypothetical protein LZ31DRAFT_549692 [Colletotrichum somersetense]